MTFLSRSRLIPAFLFALCAFVMSGSAAAAELRVLSAGAVKPAVVPIAEEFQRETGHVVTFEFAPVGTLRSRIAGGARADVVIVTDVGVDALAKEGAVMPGTRVDLARVGVGVAVKEGAPLPDISTSEALKRTLLAAKSVVYIDPASGGSSGIHFAQVLERLGIADAVNAKATRVPGGYALEPVARGEVELGVQQWSEILAVKGVAYVGPLPKELQKTTTYAAGIMTGGAEPEAARVFVRKLKAYGSLDRFRAAGLEPAE